MNRPWIAVLFSCAVSCSVACAGCGEDTAPEFFSPLEFGEYEYEPEPDISAPTLVDFGLIQRGESAVRLITVRDVGRLPLIVSGVELSGAGFSRTDVEGDEWSVEPGDGRILEVTYRAGSGEPSRGRLTIASNDPDEPVHVITLFANRTEPCVGTVAVDAPVWEVHDGEGPMCWPEDSPEHGHQVEYDYATVPPQDDPDWRPESDDDIEFERRSSLCGFECDCRNGGDFTYFQTSLFVPEGGDVDTYHVEISDVDDGARVSVFNDRYPHGVTDPRGYARLFGQQADADLGPYFEPGENRIVITQVDDCCSISRLRGVTIHADDVVVDRCR